MTKRQKGKGKKRSKSWHRHSGQDWRLRKVERAFKRAGIGDPVKTADGKLVDPKPNPLPGKIHPSRNHFDSL